MIYILDVSITIIYVSFKVVKKTKYQYQSFKKLMNYTIS